MKGATKIIVLAGMTKLDITIHAPMKGATIGAPGNRRLLADFNPRAREGRDRN